MRRGGVFFSFPPSLWKPLHSLPWEKCSAPRLFDDTAGDTRTEWSPRKCFHFFSLLAFIGLLKVPEGDIPLKTSWSSASVMIFKTQKTLAGLLISHFASAVSKWWTVQSDFLRIYFSVWPLHENKPAAEMGPMDIRSIQCYFETVAIKLSVSVWWVNQQN